MTAAGIWIWRPKQRKGTVRLPGERDDGAVEDQVQEDLISKLPDAMIHEIFSFLTLQDVVRSRTLSKRWRSVSASNPYINLSLPSLDCPSSRQQFACSIRRALRLAPNVEKFHLDASSLGVWCRQVYLWFSFAVEHGVRDASLRSSCDYIVLPWDLHRCSSIVSLRVTRCKFLPAGGIFNWSSLKTLCMEFVNLCVSLIAKLLSGSPVLESLVIRGCWSMDEVVIESITLRELVIEDYSIDIRRPTKVKLSAPRLLVLRLLGGLSHWNFIALDEISSLVEVELDLVLRSNYWGSYSKYVGMLLYLLHQLRHVPKVTVGNWCLQVLSDMRENGLLRRLPSSTSKWQNLILRTSFSRLDVQGIAYMLESSPHLENLVIHRTSIFEFEVGKDFLDCFVFDDEEFWRRQKKLFPCVANHLRSVKFVGYSSDCLSMKGVLSLLMFLLEEAIVLEKMTIKAEVPKVDPEVPIEAINSWVLLGVIELLTGHPKASKKAELIFNDPIEQLALAFCCSYLRSLKSKLAEGVTA